MELFLDANAHVTINQKALDAFVKFNNSLAGHGHPSALSKPARQAASKLEEAREKVAMLIGAKSSSQIVFTSGCTQACEWALKCFFEVSKNETLAIGCSSVEHPAVRQAASLYEKQYKTKVYNYNIDKNSNIDFNNYLVNKNICTAVQNEFGSVYNIPSNKLSFVDASQALGKIEFDVSHYDFAVFAGHKFGGFNIGFIYFKNIDHWKEFGTGSRYFMDRPGTPDVGAVLGTAIALENAIETLDERIQKSSEFQKYLEAELKSLNYTVIAENHKRTSMTSYVHNASRAMNDLFKLNENNIYCGIGSACGSITSGLSQSISSLGFKGMPSDFIRISQFGNYGKAEASTIINILAKNK
jgi:cysteine desulfurase